MTQNVTDKKARKQDIKQARNQTDNCQIYKRIVGAIDLWRCLVECSVAVMMTLLTGVGAFLDTRMYGNFMPFILTPTGEGLGGPSAFSQHQL